MKQRKSARSSPEQGKAKRQQPSTDRRHARGRRAEDWVAAHLSATNWQVQARNLRTPYGELDLLAVDPRGEWVAVEVKAHSSDWLHAEQRLRPRQAARLVRALSWLLARREQSAHPPDMDAAVVARVDLITVRLEQGEPCDFEHFEDVAQAHDPS